MILKPFKLIAVFLVFVITGCEWHNSYDHNEINKILLYLLETEWEFRSYMQE